MPITEKQIGVGVKVGSAGAFLYLKGQVFPLPETFRQLRPQPSHQKRSTLLGLLANLYLNAYYSRSVALRSR